MPSATTRLPSALAMPKMARTMASLRPRDCSSSSSRRRAWVNQVAQAPVIQTPQQRRRLAVAQMAQVAAHAGLQRRRIGTLGQHPRIVVELQKQRIETVETGKNMRCQTARVGEHTGLLLIARVNSIPSAASRSIFGVRMSLLP